MNPKQILIIEDAHRLAKLMQDYLTQHGFKVVVESQGDRGLSRLLKLQPDLVIVDVMLPGMDGLTICREARQYYDGLMLILTAKTEEEVEITGLSEGADDFVRKPIDPRVLLARIEALFRRKEGRIQPSTLEIGQLKMDPASQSVYWRGDYISLSHKEFELLFFLADHRGRPVNREQISQALRGFDYDGVNRAIDVLIVNLRKKFEDNIKTPTRIKTVWGKGYLFVPEAWE